MNNEKEIYQGVREETTPAKVTLGLHKKLVLTILTDECLRIQS